MWYPAWRVSVFRVFLVRVFQQSDWIQTRKTQNRDTFHALIFLIFSYLFQAHGQSLEAGQESIRIEERRFVNLTWRIKKGLTHIRSIFLTEEIGPKKMVLFTKSDNSKQRRFQYLELRFGKRLNIDLEGDNVTVKLKNSTHNDTCTLSLVVLFQDSKDETIIHSATRIQICGMLTRNSLTCLFFVQRNKNILVVFSTSKFFQKSGESREDLFPFTYYTKNEVFHKGFLQFPADLVTFTEKILIKKLHFLCSGWLRDRNCNKEVTYYHQHFSTF